MRNFYLSGSAALGCVSDEFFFRSADELYEALKQCWSRETCAPRMRERWSEENFTCGQCSITAFLAQDIFGGEVYGVPLEDGNFHCFNVVGETVFDLTNAQFGKKKLDYDRTCVQSREKHFTKAEKRRRYELLREKLKKICRDRRENVMKKDMNAADERLEKTGNIDELSDDELEGVSGGFVAKFVTKTTASAEKMMSALSCDCVKKYSDSGHGKEAYFDRIIANNYACPDCGRAVKLR